MISRDAYTQAKTEGVELAIFCRRVGLEGCQVSITPAGVRRWNITASNTYGGLSTTYSAVERLRPALESIAHSLQPRRTSPRQGSRSPVAMVRAYNR